MIPNSYIIEWSKFSPWPQPSQIEQDLIISRALLDIYNHPVLSKTLAFRGGTALNKLIFKPSSRYSEDIDLVQINGEPIGETFNLIQSTLSWLGKPKRDLSKINSTLTYSFLSEDNFKLKLKVEINIREHKPILELKKYFYNCVSSWCKGEAMILSYNLEELLGTKLRALYQRRKGRDLFDLYMALKKHPDLNIDKMILCFKSYLALDNKKISKQEFIISLDEKIKKNDFIIDTTLLLPNTDSYNVLEAYDLVCKKIINKI